MNDLSRDEHGQHVVSIPIDTVTLEGALSVPENAPGIAVFVHGSGSSRLSPRNQAVARALRDAGLATLLFDLLTTEEETAERETALLRFDISLLAERLLAATDWLRLRPDTSHLQIGYFGASTGAAAALVAAASRSDIVGAVVSRGGRPDLAGNLLPQVNAPTLLIVGGDDPLVLGLNQEALAQLRCEKKLEVIAGATHLFEEPGTLEQAATLARDWFMQHLKPIAPDPRRRRSVEDTPLKRL